MTHQNFYLTDGAGADVCVRLSVPGDGTAEVVSIEPWRVRDEVPRFEPEPPRRRLPGKAWSYTKAKASQALEGAVPDEVQAARRFCCTGLVTLVTVEGERRDVRAGPACPHFRPLEHDPSDGHCAPCGCPKTIGPFEWAESLMSHKWPMPRAGCVHGRYGDAAGRRATDRRCNGCTCTEA